MPFWFQNLGISIYNTYLYKIRHGGRYKELFDFYSNISGSQNSYLIKEREDRLTNFLRYATNHSAWYRKVAHYKSLQCFPVLTKAELVSNLAEIATVSEKQGVVSYTGGTTGASLKVIYTKEDMQERFAVLDAFRASYGYTLGKKVAWFSGKSLVTQEDLLKGRCYRDDWINNIRFFSTFHVSEQYFESYWAALNNFNPEFLVGFPSSVYDICNLAEARGLKYSGNVKVFFPTAETVLPMHREVIERVLGCILVDQYASSEGAPFILECEYGIKHIHPLTGIFEVVNDKQEPADSGELLVTSFTTHGTPLIRYKIGDRITLGPQNTQCKCGSYFPVAESIEGRSTDYILSRENGKVNLGNISNATKDILGILSFQLVQDVIDMVTVKVVANTQFTSTEKEKFIFALKLRLGETMAVKLTQVDNIPNEKSGKFRIVVNNMSVK